MATLQATDLHYAEAVRAGAGASSNEAYRKLKDAALTLDKLFHEGQLVRCCAISSKHARVPGGANRADEANVNDDMDDGMADYEEDENGTAE